MTGSLGVGLGVGVADAGGGGEDGGTDCVVVPLGTEVVPSHAK
jgi:hypothetical protein